MLGDPRDQGPVVYWRPFDGSRHALSPNPPPRDGQTRETLCGVTTTLAEPSELDWLDPTCPQCWVEAKERLRQRQERRRQERQRQERERNQGEGVVRPILKTPYSRE